MKHFSLVITKNHPSFAVSYSYSTVIESGVLIELKLTCTNRSKSHELSLEGYPSTRSFHLSIGVQGKPIERWLRVYEIDPLD